jgi:DNA-binding NarL/FixJ family response regulator
MEKRIRVLVANRPRLIRELILMTFAEQPDIEIVGEVREEDYENIARTVDETQPEFLILGFDKPERRPPLCDALLRRHPEMKILAVAENNGSSIFYWAKLDIRSTPLETSEAAILDALRGGMRELGRTM